MCNLSEGIEKKGIEIGQENEKLASARRMIAAGKLSAEDIAGFSDLPLERVKELMQEQSA